MQSIVFTWNRADYAALLASCSQGMELPFILEYMPRDEKILEAGCGLGRYVAYLADRGFDIEGIEINPETVALVNGIRPDIRVHVGDVICLPYMDNSLAGIISLGVVEHFIEGPEKPLREIWRVLRPGHHAIITVPSFNLIRKLKTAVGYHFVKEKIKSSRLLRLLLKKEKLEVTADPKLRLFRIYKEKGRFFEYRFAKKEFEYLLERAGFVVIESVPIAHMDGIYHEFGQWLVSFRNWRFYPCFAGLWLNRFLSGFPFVHNHMHLCVVKKPLV